MTGNRGVDHALTVLIVEDHVMVSQALQMALAAEDGIEVVGLATTLEAGAAMARTLQPAVVILDSRLPDGEALDGVRMIHKESESTAVLVLSAMADYDTVVRTLEAGANGYLLKDQSMQELVHGVRAVADGGRPLAPRLVSALVSRVTRSTTPAHQLSRREIEVLRLLAEGCSTEELSERMSLSVNTVRNHVQKAIRRLGAHSKLEAVAIAQREGIIASMGVAAFS